MSTATAPPDASSGLPSNRIQVSVVYALPQDIWRRTMVVASGSTVIEVLRASGFFEAFPAITQDLIHVGIYGRRCGLDQRLQPNDRIEVYRPLVFDPMESRRRRARHKKNQARARGNRVADPSS